MVDLVTRADPVEDPIDPKEAIMGRIGEWLDRIDIGGQDVLIAIYEPSPEAKVRGFRLPDKTRDEYHFQGITGLVLKLGPHAFNTEKTCNWFENRDHEPNNPKPGDWVVFDIKDTKQFYIRTQLVRVIPAQYIVLRVPIPDLAK